MLLPRPFTKRERALGVLLASVALLALVPLHGGTTLGPTTSPYSRPLQSVVVTPDPVPCYYPTPGMKQARRLSVLNPQAQNNPDSLPKWVE